MGKAHSQIISACYERKWRDALECLNSEMTHDTIRCVPVWSRRRRLAFFRWENINFNETEAVHRKETDGWMDGYSVASLWCFSNMMNVWGSEHCHQRANPELGTCQARSLSTWPPRPRLSRTARPPAVMILAPSEPKVAGSCWTAGRWCRNRDECASLLLGIIIRRLSAPLSLPPARSSFLIIRLLAGRLGRKSEIGFSTKNYVNRGPHANRDCFGGS